MTNLLNFLTQTQEGAIILSCLTLLGIIVAIDIRRYLNSKKDFWER